MTLKKFDKSFLNGEIKTLAGVDEAGRGPLAGPVVAAAAIFDNSFIIPEVNDSKKLSEKVRERLFEEIISSALSYGVGIVEPDEIDRINILQAALKAMKIAVENLSVTPDIVLIDGNKSFVSELRTKTIVKGDSKSFSIAAASIIAKVTRDRIMRKAAARFPGYLWEANKGYGTKAHFKAIKELGVTELHRKSFLRKFFSET